MNSFAKYFLHFSIISIVIILIFTALQLFSDEKLHPHIIRAFIISIFTFSLVMSIVFEVFLVREVQMSIQFNSNFEKEYIISKIEDIVVEKTRRKIKVNENEKTIFMSNNKYNNWLTNPIVVYKGNNEIIIITPKAYKKYFSNLTIQD